MPSVAVIDSGVHLGHPHINRDRIVRGISVTSEHYEQGFDDRIGHGTAVAAAIQGRAPEADLLIVKIFERKLVTTGLILLRAIDWCIEQHADWINLSLGTPNPDYCPEFQVRIERAIALGMKIVAATEMDGRPAYPGSMPGVIGVVLDYECPRESPSRLGHAAQEVYAASGYPRPIPGVPPERNLKGISFAVANVTGALAAGFGRG